jgi:tetratricopeptide (TPR) repeat protein
VLSVRTLVGTILALAAVGIAAYFWHRHQMGRTASALADRAEAFAEEKNPAAAAGYYDRYLELRPEDANARLRRAELVGQLAGGRGGLQRTVELYQEALKPASQGLAPEKELQARRRLTELMLQAEMPDAAESEWKKLQELEQKELAQKPEEWRWPGLNALIVLGKFRGKNSGESRVTPKKVEETFAEVLEPEKGKPKFYQDPQVYLARYAYRLQNLPDATDPKQADAYHKALEAAKNDLESAVKLAPTNPSILLIAADAAKNESAAAAKDGNPEKAGESYAKACDYCERAVAAAPADSRAYLFLGRLYKGLGSHDRAIQVWRRGLKEVKPESASIELNLDLAEALIERRQVQDAETVMKNLDAVLAKLDLKAKLSLQRLIDLRSAKLAYLRGRYDEAVRLATDLAAGKNVVQGGSGPTTTQVNYEALNVLGGSHAALKQWDQALTAYEQAALLAPQEIAPHLAAAEINKAAADIDKAAGQIDKAAGRSAAAIVSYEKALAIVNAMKPPPEGRRQAIYEALIALLEAEKRTAEADRYRALRTEQISASLQLTLQDVGQAIRAGNLDEALTAAQRGVESHAEDPMAYLALGRAQRANKDDAKAAEANHKAFEKAKDAPALQMQLAEILLRTADPSDAAEAEEALRGLLARHPPACLRLVALLGQRGKNDEALAIAQSAVKTFPKDPLAHIALGTAWWGKKENSKAEAAFQDAAKLATDAMVPATAYALLEFYAATGREKLARDTFEKMFRNAKLPEIDRELLRGQALTRLGDRTGAKDAYRKAVEASKEDPVVEMQLAEFLLGSSDPADEAEAEKLLHGIMRQYDPARRRLAEVLINRGGEEQWEEAQKLLEQSAGNPISFVDRFVQARSLARRGGAENLGKAVDVCQALLKEAKQPVPGVCLLLAQIRELQNKPDEARKQYQTLVQGRPTATQLATYVVFLLRRGPAEEADEQLKQLEKLAPDDLGTVELRARWLRDQKRTAEIEPLVEGVAKKLGERVGKDNPQQAAQLALAAGNLYGRIEQYPAAERWYRQLLKLRPEGYEPLAMSLAKQGRIQEAVALCDEAGKTDSSVQPAMVLTMVLLSGRATVQDMAAAEPFLKKALETHKDRPALLASVANVRVAQDRSLEAIELYRQILAQQPKDIGILNNLATLLAEQPEPERRKEALNYIEQAIKLVGPQPLLLDTEAMALFQDGKADQAVALLQQAVQSPVPDPRWCFHLAVAYGQLGQLDQARAALQQARAGDLDHQLLTKTDHQLLADLEKKLAKP